MKKFILFSILIAGIFTFSTDKLSAQNVNVSINIGNQPSWGPVGYKYARYYYFPDINCYYDINRKFFYFLSGNRWRSGRYLPSRYQKYDLYNIYKVVINNQQEPWLHNRRHISAYGRYKGGYKNELRQDLIRDCDNTSSFYQSRNNNVEWRRQGQNNSRNSSGTRNRNGRQNPGNNSDKGQKQNDNFGNRGDDQRGR